MKSILLAALTLLSVSAVSQDNPVIVELFTSQGCSSCPAADDNLRQIIDQAQVQGLPIYGLSFHVDYWNYIGWKDPYSSKEFTERQKTYARRMNLDGIYTPQMIVNGREELIGSNRAEAKKLIDKALSEPKEFKFEVATPKLVGDKIQIEYQLNKKPTSKDLNVALVSRSVKNFVSRGENTGKTLNHGNVVVYFRAVVAQQQGVVVIPKSSRSKAPQMIVLFLSDPTGKIIGACSKDIGKYNTQQ